MSSSAEDFTSDDLLNPGFCRATTSPSLEAENQPDQPVEEEEEEQNQPIEIPRGPDDNSEWEGSRQGDQC